MIALYDITFIPQEKPSCLYKRFLFKYLQFAVKQNYYWQNVA